MSIIHQIGLTLVEGVGHIYAKQLLAHFGSAELVFKANFADLMAIPGFREPVARRLLAQNVLKQAETQLKFTERYGIRVFSYTDNGYPRRLRNCPDAPVVLYFKGKADLNHSRVISVVGTRRATDYGRQLCRVLCEELAVYDVLVISGLAYGIDIAAHQECLRYGMPTIGVLAHGLDRIYPPIHKPIATKMLETGGLLTEFPVYTEPLRGHFPQRNRIIAGMADATIVVEAIKKGGALITAELAGSYDRDVYAFPGRVGDRSSQGCNALIRSNKAAMITSAEDLIFEMGWEKQGLDKSIERPELFANITDEERRIVELLKEGPMHIDELTVISQFSQGMLAMYLLELEMRGLLVSMPGKYYGLVPTAG